MKKYFYLDESMMCKGKYAIHMNHDLFPFPTGIGGSYNVLVARVLNLSYPDYLKYCASIGAKLRGSEGYAYPSWKERAAADKLCKKLNEEWEKVVKECFGKEN